MTDLFIFHNVSHACTVLVLHVPTLAWVRAAFFTFSWDCSSLKFLDQPSVLVSLAPTPRSSYSDIAARQLLCFLQKQKRFIWYNLNCFQEYNFVLQHLNRNWGGCNLTAASLKSCFPIFVTLVYSLNALASRNICLLAIFRWVSKLATQEAKRSWLNID